MNTTSHRKDLKQILHEAITSVQPRYLMAEVLRLDGDTLQVGEENFPIDQFKNIFIAGAGKASASMAAETEKVLSHHITDGVIAIKGDHHVPLRYIRPIEAGHPVPDLNSVIAANEIKALMKKAGPGDLVIFLLSGGASSLMTDLPPGCELEDINHTFHLLLNSGASIKEMNIVRKHLSLIKGGHLASLSRGAVIVNFIISDVIGNNLSTIGSGPTVPDTSTFRDAINVLDKYKLTYEVPDPVMGYLKKGLELIIPDTLKSQDPAFQYCRNYIIGDINVALHAAEKKARELGYDTHIISSSLSGDAEKAARDWAQSSIREGKQLKKSCLIAGGETTVKVTGKGKGGRNQQFALAAAIELQYAKNISILTASTDGSDGPTDAAGAIVDCETYSKAKAMKLSPEDYLLRNDTYTFFEKTGDHLKTGPTQTNVMDIVITLIH